MKKLVKLHTINPPAGELAVVGTEPTWDGMEVWNEATRKSSVRRALSWYAYCGDKKNYRRFLEEWVATPHGQKHKNAVKAIPDRVLTSTVPSLCRMILKGFIPSPSELSYIDQFMATASEREQESSKRETLSPVKSVHEKMREQILPLFHVMEDFVDACIFDKRIPVSTPAEAFPPDLVEKLKPQHVSLLKKFVDRHRAEIEEVLVARKQGGDEQLLEGYHTITDRRLRTILDGLNTTIASLATKAPPKAPRKKRPVDKKRLAKKVAYKEADPSLAITSVSPVGLFECTEVWAFDTKTRKLVRYVSTTTGGITVKGTTLHGWDESRSGQKTLRKEKEQLMEFTKLRKNQLHKWFDAIRAKPLSVTGRLNKNMVLLRIL